MWGGINRALDPAEPTGVGTHSHRNALDGLVHADDSADCLSVCELVFSGGKRQSLQRTEFSEVQRSGDGGVMWISYLWTAHPSLAELEQSLPGINQHWTAQQGPCTHANREAAHLCWSCEPERYRSLGNQTTQAE